MSEPTDTAPLPMRPQPHGGALRSGGPNGGAGGRPLLIQSPEEMEQRLEDYLSLCRDPDAPRPITLTGMVMHMGFCARSDLDAYEARPEFRDIVKRARLAVEQSYEHRLDRDRPTGAIFALKNMGWSDQQTIELRGALANLDMNRLSDEQIARIGAGEPVMAVLASSIERLALPAGPPAASEPEPESPPG